MSQKKDDIFAQEMDDAAGGSELFGSNVTLSPTEKELFVGNFSFLKDIPIQPEVKKSQFAAGKGVRPLYAILGVNLAITCILVGIILYRPASSIGPKTVEAETVVSAGSTENPVNVVQPETKTDSHYAETKTATKPDTKKPALTKDDEKQLGQGTSLKTADTLFAKGEYSKANHVYSQIASGLTVSGLEDEFLKNYLSLRMALCLLRENKSGTPEKYFTEALQSRSGLIRGLAGYYLSLTYFQNGDYLQSRKLAYQTLAVYETFKETISSSVESDLYFLAAESLSRHVLKLHSEDSELPGKLWSDSLADIWPKDMNQDELCRVLVASANKLASGATGPELIVDMNRPVGSQWSLVCLQNPLEEVLIDATTQAGAGLIWKSIDPVNRSRPVTACMQFVPQQYAIEAVTGSVGLVWKYDGQTGLVLDPDEYDDLIRYRSDLIEESISLWQRFLLRYRGDHRIPNAHYLLGRLYSMDLQFAEGLGEFKLIQGHYIHNPLAPYAFLQAGQIKTKMKDYEGARQDLNEMLIQFPDCKIADQVTLSLAQAMLESGQIKPAAELFNRVYQMGISRTAKLDSSIGLGRAAFAQKDWANTRKWLGQSLELLEDKNDTRVVSVCTMYGQVCKELGEYKQATVALRMALAAKTTNQEYVRIIMELAESDMKQGNYLSALNTLEGVPQERLNQEDSCELLIAKTYALREIDAGTAAISLLRRKIEFIAESHLRAWLTLELAQCHYDQEDYVQARRELNEVIPDMQNPVRSQRAQLLLAQIAEKLNQPAQAEVFCNTILSTSDVDTDIRKKTFELLGRIYTAQKQYDKAAMAFAGIDPKGMGL